MASADYMLPTCLASISAASRFEIFNALADQALPKFAPFICQYPEANDVAVSCITAITIYRQWFFCYNIIYKKRNEFFGKMIGAVIIGTVGNDHG